MLVTTNATITIKRFARTSGKGAYTTVETGVKVYINSIQEELVEGMGGEGSFFAFRMMTRGNHTAIELGDRIIDGDNKQYEVKGKSISKDITGTHHQYLISEKYD